MNRTSNWYSDFFTGLVADTLVDLFPPELTRAEVDFLLEACPERASSPRILDAPCGAGRHCLELARRGHDVTGIDISEEAIAEARRAAAREGLTATFEVRDMRDPPAGPPFDLACCLGNSFAYFDDRGNRYYLRSMFENLGPGGRLVLDAGALIETVLPHHDTNSWCTIGDILMLRESRYDPVETRVITDYTLMRGAETEKKTAIYRVYTFRQLRELIEATGFRILRAAGSVEGEDFALGAHQAIFVAEKPD